MNTVKTWQERVEYPDHGDGVRSRDCAMLAEIEELRTCLTSQSDKVVKLETSLAVAAVICAERDSLIVKLKAITSADPESLPTASLAATGTPKDPICTIRGFDEYGPLISWHTSWISLPPMSQLYLVPSNSTSVDTKVGYALAMRVLQSDLYRQLDDLERAECDGLIAQGQKVSLSSKAP